jgi:hypothetical protein
MSRLEQSLFLMFSRGDRGYGSFLGMVLMIHVLNLRGAVDEQKPLPSDVESSAGPSDEQHSPRNRHLHNAG